MRWPFADDWKGIVAGFSMIALGVGLFRFLLPGDPIWYEPPAAPFVDDPNLVENPYALCLLDSPDTSSLSKLYVLLMFVLAGALAARIGASAVAWRGLFAGLLGAAAFASIILPRDPLAAVLAGVAVGLLAYAGGGLAKLYARMRARAA